jgi:hypothetical protein
MVCIWGFYGVFVLLFLRDPKRPSMVQLLVLHSATSSKKSMGNLQTLKKTFEDVVDPS